MSFSLAILTRLADAGCQTVGHFKCMHVGAQKSMGIPNATAIACRKVPEVLKPPKACLRASQGLSIQAPCCTCFLGVRLTDCTKLLLCMGKITLSLSLSLICAWRAS